MPLDPVPSDGGAVHYLKGSHKWGMVFQPTPFKNIREIVDAYVEPPFDFAVPPDFDADYANYDWLVGEVELGDAIVWQVLTVHGSGANRTANYRRAVTSLHRGSGDLVSALGEHVQEPGLRRPCPDARPRTGRTDRLRHVPAGMDRDLSPAGRTGGKVQRAELAAEDKDRR